MNERKTKTAATAFPASCPGATAARHLRHQEHPPPLRQHTHTHTHPAHLIGHGVNGQNTATKAWT